MAVMLDADRAALHAEIMRGLMDTPTLTKPQLRAAVDAIDQWLSDNAVSLNLAIPAAARAALTAAQKARLLALVALKRFDRGA